MRILYVSYMYPPVAPGGAQQVAYELFKASLARGDEAYLISALEHEHEAVYGKPGAPIVPVHGESRQYFYFPQFYDFLNLSVGDWRTIQFFREFVERIAPDVVHFHHYHRIGVESIRAARIAAPQASITLTFHEMMAICMADGQMLKRGTRELCYAATPLDCNRCFPELRPEYITLRAARLKAVLDECDSFVFPSEFIAERYVEWGLDPDKCAVIPNGQNSPAPDFDKSQHARSVNRFGFFGQFIDNKGVDVALEAILILAREKRIPACGIELDINGGNQHYASTGYIDKVNGLMRTINELGVGPLRIDQKGRYSREELAGRMRDVDWVLVPSTWWEVFGLVASEAWMFGRPVIASAIGGLKERVVHGVNGLSVPARDARALADAIVLAAGNEALWLKLHAGITQPWSQAEMLDAHLALWAETRGKQTRSGVSGLMTLSA